MGQRELRDRQLGVQMVEDEFHRQGPGRDVITDGRFGGGGGGGGGRRRRRLSELQLLDFAPGLAEIHDEAFNLLAVALVQAENEIAIVAVVSASVPQLLHVLQLNLLHGLRVGRGEPGHLGAVKLGQGGQG